MWLSKAFDKHATDPEKEGTGLRLAIVKQIVEAHGVTVNAESVHGTGPTFTLALRMLLASICAFHQPYFFSHPQNRIHFRRDRGEDRFMDQSAALELAASAAACSFRARISSGVEARFG